MRKTKNTHSCTGLLFLPSASLFLAVLVACTSIAHLAYAEEAVDATGEGDAASTPADADPVIAPAEEEESAKSKPQWSYGNPETGPLSWGSLLKADGKSNNNNKGIRC